MRTSSLQFKVLLIAAGPMAFAVSVAVFAISKTAALVPGGEDWEEF